MSTEAHYYCHKCDKRVDVSLFTAGRYRVGIHLYCAACYEEEMKK